VGERLPYGKILLSLAIPYGIALATLHLIAYWGAVRVNPFQYASASDLTSAGLSALAITLLLMPLALLVGATIGARLAVAHDNVSIGSGSAGAKPASSLLPSRDRVSDSIFWGAVIAVPLVILLVEGAIKYAILSFCMTVVVMRPVAASKVLAERIPSDHVRIALVFLVVTLPFLAYFKGASESQQARSSSKGMIVDVARSGIAKSLRQPLFYMGMLGSSHLLYEERTGSVIFLPVNDDRMLVVTPSRNTGL